MSEEPLFRGYDYLAVVSVTRGDDEIVLAFGVGGDCDEDATDNARKIIERAISGFDSMRVDVFQDLEFVELKDITEQQTFDEAWNEFSEIPRKRTEVDQPGQPADPAPASADA